MWRPEAPVPSFGRGDRRRRKTSSTSISAAGTPMTLPHQETSMPIDPTTTVPPVHAPQGAQAAQSRKTMSKASAITAITIGGALELYDSGVYNFFATLIIPLYFPVGNPLGQLLPSFGTFGAGYLMRPLGGLIIGAYADRRGRKPAVLMSMWLMALSALILVVTPPYAQLGILAPALMIVARLVQGFAIGGEMGSATAM